MFNGLLLIDKPEGWTSHDVVAKVRGILNKQANKKVKVGHTGTLDPMATGLLILVVGSYTKRAAEFSKLDKTYEATMKLGKTSSTGDAEGKKTDVSDKKPSEKEIEQALKSFIGEIEQIPPAYSAVKIGGRRAYKLAREGKELKLEPRKVKIYAITSVNYDFPYLSFTTKVSSGTYIRSLGEDIGHKLGTGAYLTKLTRLKIGKFGLAGAIPPTNPAITESITT
ncbi:MAG TPA: tRNA pseudouridine(55) synthase TruB [Candidatus Saccharimonadales bacterium]|nr:tRNA pseudouridine(55) synthase TruB [Candidatus Saccharimonadales bacterium]